MGSALNGLAQNAAAPTGAVWGEDLFRYDQFGNRSLNTTLASPAYFSLDGTTDLALFGLGVRARQTREEKLTGVNPDGITF